MCFHIRFLILLLLKGTNTLLTSPVFIPYTPFTKCKNQGTIHILKIITVGLISSIRHEFYNYSSLLTITSNLVINIIYACRMSNTASISWRWKALLGVAIKSGREHKSTQAWWLEMGLWQRGASLCCRELQKDTNQADIFSRSRLQITFLHYMFFHSLPLDTNYISLLWYRSKDLYSFCSITHLSLD